MIGYRLSRTGMAEHPFYITSIGAGIWSVEELCFFICHNPALVDEGMLNAQLTRWLTEEFHLTTIAAGMERGMKRGDLPGELVTPLLRGVGYLDTQELKKLMKVFARMESGGSAVRLFLKGDALARNGLYGEAAAVYRRAEEAAGKKEDRLLPGILHNHGTALMQILSLEEAVRCFRKAYELDKTPERLRTYLLALGLAKPEEQFLEEAAAAGADEEMVRLVRETLAEAGHIEVSVPEDPGAELERIRDRYHREAGR